MKHTPGPWQRVDEEITGGPDYNCICSIVATDVCDGDEVDANLQLIAAAPDLLAAGEAMLAPFEGWQADEFAPATAARIAQMRAAVAKAKGAADE